MKHQRRSTHHRGAFGNALGVFLGATLIFKGGWALLVPVLFAEAVEQGTLNTSLPWSSAALIGALIGTLVFFARHERRTGMHNNPVIESTHRA